MEKFGVKNKLIVTATGDSLFTADVPEEYFSGEFLPIRDFMADADVKMTNLETNISEYGEFPGAYSGGTWLNVTPEDFEGLFRFGFNYYSTANNHCMDYSYHGLISTLNNLDKKGVAHSGTGMDLESAGAPGVVKVGDKKVAIIAVDTSFNSASKAGVKTNKMQGRPGVNYLGYTSYYPITQEQYEQMKQIAKTSKVNAYDELCIQGGFNLEPPKGVYRFGGTNFCYDGSKKRTECNAKDKARILSSIEKAKKENDLVILSIHCHTIGEDKHEDVPDYLVEIAKSAIDAGASAVIGTGTHQLRPIEIYKDCPIFYSLGDFFYQGMRVKELPADFMTKYGIDVNSTAWEGLMARSKNNTIGLQVHKCNFQTVLPKMTFENGKLTSIEMLPIVAGFNKQGKMEGLPYVAKGEEEKEIFDILDKLSKPYGTTLELENGVIMLK